MLGVIVIEVAARIRSVILWLCIPGVHCPMGHMGHTGNICQMSLINLMGQMGQVGQVGHLGQFKWVK
jgi:hypothetical protein